MGPIEIRPITEKHADIGQQPGAPNTTKLADAGRQFEALMIGQILKAAHGAGSEGWLGAGDEDESSSTALQMAEEYLGQAIANGGGLGIAKMVIQGVGKKPSTASSSAPLPLNSNTFRTHSLIQE